MKLIRAVSKQNFIFSMKRVANIHIENKKRCNDY